jgi:hypothetical protein
MIHVLRAWWVYSWIHGLDSVITQQVAQAQTGLGAMVKE